MSCRHSAPLRFMPLLFALFLGACTIPDAGRRMDAAARLAAGAGWRLEHLPAGRFELAAFLPARLEDPEKPVRIYIEGDGLAWINAGRVSSDPTPVNPLALKLALLDSSRNAAYLARPCQFARKGGTSCGSEWWTDKRFSHEAVDAAGMAIDRIKQRFHTEKVILIGYSGGGAIGALVAARRKDVAALVTVAGNLDTARWTALHGIRPLAGSLNPADYAGLLEHVPQKHYSGAEDAIVPPQIARDYAARFRNEPAIVLLPGADHSCCWEQYWQSRQAEIFTFTKP
jgi:alpha/beta hydrolase fold.